MGKDETVYLLSDCQDDTPEAPGVGRRHFVVFLVFLGMVNGYALRSNPSVALLAMVNNTAISGTLMTSNTSQGDLDDIIEADICPVVNHSPTDLQTGEFNWDANTQGLILSSFFYGYITTQLIGGQLAQKYGGKVVFGIGIAMTSFLSLLTPVLAQIHVSLLIATMVLKGIAQGVTVPAMFLVVAKWSPKSERTFFGTVVLSGNSMGTVTSAAASGVLARYAGWPSIFYVFGSLGMLWSMIWLVSVTESPADNKNISKKEKLYIEHTTGNTQKSSTTPWLSIFTSLPVWAAIVGHTTYNWAFYFLLTTLPSYLQQVLHFRITENGLASALPFLVLSIVQVISSVAEDHIITKRYLNVTTVRCTAGAIGLFLPATILVIQGYIGCNQATSVAMLCISTGLLGIAESGPLISYYDIAPIHVGTICGIGNTFATIPGMISPSIVERITKASPYMSRWRTVFFISLGISVFGGILYILGCSGMEQEWAKNSKDIESTEDSNEDKKADQEICDKDYND